MTTGSGDSIRQSREFPECPIATSGVDVALAGSVAIAPASDEPPRRQGPTHPLTGDSQVLLNKPQGFVGRVAAWAPES